MSKLIIPLMSLLVLVGCNSKESSAVGSTQKISLIEYYKILPQEYLFFEKEHKKYPIVFENGKWQSINELKTKNPVVYDKKNGFLKIEDYGTGGGWFKIELAKFIDNKQREIIAVNVMKSIAGFVRFKKLSFYSYQDKRIINVTKKVLPKINIYSFASRNLDKNNFKYIKKMLGESSLIGYELPRHGLNIKCFFVTATLNFFSMADNEGKKERQKAIGLLIKQLRRRKFHLQWNMAKGKFFL